MQFWGLTHSTSKIRRHNTFYVKRGFVYVYASHILTITHSSSLQGGHTHCHTTTHETFESVTLIQSETEGKPKQSPSKTNKALVGMMLLGKALHTMADGLAIGAAFSKSAGDGLSTSLAVLFHEIPNAVGRKMVLVLREVHKLFILVLVII